jgi:hypothetical protein
MRYAITDSENVTSPRLFNGNNIDLGFGVNVVSAVDARLVQCLASQM